MNKIKSYYTLTEVAEKLGVSRQWIHMIITGKKSCNKKTYENLKKYYPNLVWVEINKPHYQVIRIDGAE